MTIDSNNTRGSHAASNEEYQERYRRAVEEGKVKTRASRGRHAAPAAEDETAASSRAAANEEALRRQRAARAARQQQAAQAMNQDPRAIRAQQRAAQQSQQQSQQQAQAQRQAQPQSQQRAAQQRGAQRVGGQAPVVAASATRANAAQSNANQAYINQAYGAGPDGPGGSNQVQMPKKKKHRGLKIFLGVLIALLLAGGIGFGVYYSVIAGKMKLPNAEDFLGVLTDAKADEPFYVLVIGSDTWEGNGSRSDAMVLCRIDLKNTTVHMVSVPRDTPYMLNGQVQKLNEVYNSQGEAACVAAVSELTGVPISHYVRLEFDQLENVVNALGGVTVKVPYTFDYVVYTNDRDPVHVDAGVQTLTGEQAVALARMRKAYNNLGVSTDAVRQANIRAMMTGVIKQVLSLPATEIPAQVSTLAGMVNTDVDASTIVSWAMAFSGKDVTLYSCTGPTRGDKDAETGLWLTYEAPEQWAKLMAVVDAGGDPEGVIDQEYTADEE